MKNRLKSGFLYFITLLGIILLLIGLNYLTLLKFHKIWFPQKYYGKMSMFELTTAFHFMSRTFFMALCLILYAIKGFYSKDKKPFFLKFYNSPINFFIGVIILLAISFLDAFLVNYDFYNNATVSIFFKFFEIIDSLHGY